MQTFLLVIFCFDILILLFSAFVSFKSKGRKPIVTPSGKTIGWRKHIFIQPEEIASYAQYENTRTTLSNNNLGHLRQPGSFINLSTYFRTIHCSNLRVYQLYCYLVIQLFFSNLSSLVLPHEIPPHHIHHFPLHPPSLPLHPPHCGKRKRLWSKYDRYDDVSR